MPKLTMDAIKRLAPDAKAVAAARSVANPKHWPDLGQDGDVLWGRCQGSDLYSVWVNPTTATYDCGCPSRKRPCKHALGLLMLDAGGHPIPAKAAPQGLREAAEPPYFDSSWE